MPLLYHPRTASGHNDLAISREKEQNMSNNELTIEEKMERVIKTQKAADKAYAAIEDDFPEAWARLENIRLAREKAEALKADIRQDLIEAGDTDVHQIEGFNISVSKIAKIVVSDSDKVPMDYKTPTKEKWDVDVETAKRHFKVTGVLPEGFADKSTYKLNWNAIKNA